jgi:hypothetical protein
MSSKITAQECLNLLLWEEGAVSVLLLPEGALSLANSPAITERPYQIACAEEWNPELRALRKGRIGDFYSALFAELNFSPAGIRRAGEYVAHCQKERMDWTGILFRGGSIREILSMKTPPSVIILPSDPGDNSVICLWKYSCEGEPSIVRLLARAE